MATKYVPPSASGHVAVPIGDKLYRWGGHGSEKRRNMVDVFDVSKEQWECLTTHGTPPPGIQYCAYTVIGSTLFTFGGFDDGHYCHNSLHQLDTKTMEWRELVARNPSDAPQKKSGCKMVSFTEDKLVIFAGLTEHGERTGELHVFDTKEMTWSPKPTTGTKPPPLNFFTFTKIGATRAVVFGGDDGTNRHNDVYILDMRTWQWILLNVSGPPTLSVRVSHTACCLAGLLTGQEHPLLLVVGGLEGSTTLNDIWLLDVDGRRWKQVALPEAVAILPRHGHSATGFGAGPHCRQLVLWGGQKILWGHPIGETTLLNFDWTRGELKVTSVVKEDQVGKPVERLQAAVRDANRRTQDAEEEAQRQIGEAVGRLADTEERLRQAEESAAAAEERNRALLVERRLQDERQFWVVQRGEIELTAEELGRGGWAVVRVAKFRGLRVAAKCLHTLIISDYNHHLFTREMNIAATVRHPNLIQFMGATVVGEPIILTELMATSLRAVLERRPLNPPQITSISLDVARALNYLHLMRPDPIIHRDISSANVLLDPAPNNTWRAKVSDYGSANFLQRVATVGPGNPTYAAPEANDPSRQSPKMDVYSYGVLLLETCSQRFPDSTNRDALFQLVQQPTMVGLIRQCLEHDPNRRPTMSAVIEQLDEQ